MNFLRLFSVRMWALCFILCAGGCPPKIVRIPQPAGAVPTALDVATAQQRRLVAVPSLALRGHAEFRWGDTSDRHFDDGDFDLILRPPNEFSLRVGKLGEKFLWVGGGGGKSWIILPRDKPSRAILRNWTLVNQSSQVNQSSPVSDELVIGGLDGLGKLMDPARLIEALGLAHVNEHDVSNISWSEVHGAWAITLPNRRLYARGESLLPVGCDWLNSSSEVIATCTLDGFEWIRGERPVGSQSTSVQALVATRFHFSVWSGRRCKKHGPADGELSLASGVPSFGGETIRPQLFNWDDVKAALRPEVIEGPQP